MVGRFPFEIPLPDEGFAEIDSRIRLSEQYGFVEKGVLTSLFDSEDLRAEVSRLINLDILKIDEVEKTALVMGQILVDVNQLDIDNQTYLIESLGSELKEPTLAQLETLGNRILGLFVPRIAAKLATWEIITILKGPESLLELMAVCPRYFGCRYFHHWQHKYQLLKKYGSEEDQKTAKKVLNDWASVISSSQAKAKSREYEYWHLVSVHESLVRHIRKVRDLDGQPARQAIIRDTVCKVFGVSDIEKNLILRGKSSARDLALDIMVAKNTNFTTCGNKIP